MLVCYDILHVNWHKKQYLDQKGDDKMKDKLPENLCKLITFGENSTVEFKSAAKNIPNNLFETICSMLNRNGGHIYF